MAVVALAVAGGCAERPEPPPAAAPIVEGRPRLVLFLVVDQSRYDYLERFRPLFTGGLARLLDDAAVFTEAYYEHAATLTAPGHATLVTGRHPSRTGVAGNEWFDKGSRTVVSSVADRQYGRSPANLVGTTLGDWLEAADPASRVFGISAKDRSAILLAGHRADGAWWYSTQRGEWVTSRYYGEIFGEAEPEWVRAFHDRKSLDAHFGRPWEPLPVDTQALESVGIERVDRGAFDHGFPYALGDASIQPGPSFYRAVYDTPLIDEYQLAFAEALVEAEGLGRDGSPDFLGLGLSALDAVGHDFGPDSREVLDALLRLDAGLARFFAVLDRLVGMDDVLVVLSADHGVVPLPEVRWMSGESGSRVGTEEVLCFQRIGAELERRFGAGRWTLFDFYLDDAELDRRGIDRAAFETELARLIGRCPGVEKVFTRTQMLAGDAAAEPGAAGHPGPAEDPGASPDPDFRLFRNSYYEGRSPDLLIQWEPYVLDLRGFGTTHGSPHDYDRHVPWILMGPGITARLIDTPVSIVDVAPTVAALLGVTPLEDLDGRDRSDLLRSEAW